MIRKTGKMGQPGKNGTQYKKCTLVIVCESTLLANFGLVDPIGSNKI